MKFVTILKASKNNNKGEIGYVLGNGERLETKRVLLQNGMEEEFHLKDLKFQTNMVRILIALNN